MLRLKTEELEAVSIVSNGKRDLEKEKYWREVISSWQASGLSKAQFCREQGLKLNTLCGWVRNIGREGQQSGMCRLSELGEFDADMFTTVFVGNADTKRVGGRMVTPRGYREIPCER